MKKGNREKILEIARHPERIKSSYIINSLFEELEPKNSPDPALVSGAGYFNGRKVFVLGQQKPRNLEEGVKLNFGMMKPEGYEHAIKILEEAEKNNAYVVTFIDTPGADCSDHSSQGLQSWLISDCITKFCALNVPSVSYIIGEGGSGGALALQVTDKSYMLENAIYSVIAPESCGSILFRDNTKIKESLEILRPESRHILDLGIIDGIIREPREGAHTNYAFTVTKIKKNLGFVLKEFDKSSIEDIKKDRKRKVLNYGTFKTKSKMWLFKFFMREELFKPAKEVIDTKELFNPRTTLEYALAKSVLEPKFTSAGVKEKAVECGDEKNKHYIGLEDYLNNYKVCHICGNKERLTAREWIVCATDENSFHELDESLTIEDLVHEKYSASAYRDYLNKIKAKTDSNEALTIGEATIDGMRVTLAVSNFFFLGGTMGSVKGEKFVRAVKHAVGTKTPFISVCCSGGARMQEGTLALVQMAKTNMAVTELKRNNVLYLSILADPTTGGALSSYATQGDIIIAESNALISFAGPRVAELAGISLNPEYIKSEYLYPKGIDVISSRKDMKKNISNFVSLYYKFRK